MNEEICIVGAGERDEYGYLTAEAAKRTIMDLYDRGHKIAIYMVEKILGSQLTREEQEDLVQEAFLKMLIHVEHLYERTPEAQLSYLISTMRNIAIDEGRRRSQSKLLESIDEEDFPELESPELTPEEHYMMEAEAAEERMLLEVVLRRLNQQERTLLIEKYKNGRSDEEIGRMLGIKTCNVRIYLARARRKAMIYYGEEIDEKRHFLRSEDQTRPGKKPETGGGSALT